MDLKQEKAEDRARDLQETFTHEGNMVKHERYFCEWTAENFLFDKRVFLFDVVSELRKHCAEYNQDFDELMNHLKDM